MRTFEIDKREKNTYKALASCTSKEKYRQNLSYIHWDGISFHATDGIKLIRVTPSVPQLDEVPGWFTLVDMHMIEVSWPNIVPPSYERVIPSDELMEEMVDMKPFPNADSKGKDMLLYTHACFYRQNVFSPSIFVNIGACCERWDSIGQLNFHAPVRIDGKSHLSSKVTFVAMPYHSDEDEVLYTVSSAKSTA